MIRRTTITILTAALLSGCQSQWDDARKGQEAKYIGGSVDAVYDEWGVPIGVVTKTDGGKFMQFQKSQGQFWCTADVTTNANGRVMKIATGGQNGCVM